MKALSPEANREEEETLAPYSTPAAAAAATNTHRQRQQQMQKQQKQAAAADAVDARTHGVDLVRHLLTMPTCCCARFTLHVFFLLRRRCLRMS